MSVIRWLHLSDLHARVDNEIDNDDRAEVLSALWKDIELKVAAGLQPDFIIFSGDIAYHGLKEEFEWAGENFFDPLLQVAKLSRDRLFIVPGNHDINRKRIDTVSTSGMLGLIENRKKINRFLSREYADNRSHHFRKFKAFSEFVNTYIESAVFDHEEYFFVRSLSTLDETGQVTLIGLNSSWMCACHTDEDGYVDDRGYLLLGDKQVKDALKVVKRIDEGEKKSDICLTILHHPLSWLHDNDLLYIEPPLFKENDFILHGHLHRQSMGQITVPAGSAIQIPSGSVYDSIESANAYNFVEFDLSTRRGNVYVREFSHNSLQGSTWVNGNRVTGTEDGVIHFSLTDDGVANDNHRHLDSNRQRILLVENETDWQDALMSMLDSEFDVTVATSYQETMSTDILSFDAIIINLNLQDDRDWEGVAILEKLAQLPNIGKRCMVITGASTSLAGLTDRYGVTHFFPKGRKINHFNRADFLSDVNRMINQ